MKIPFHKSFRFRLLLISIFIELLMLSVLIFNSVRLVDDAINEQTRVRLHSVQPLLEAALGTKLFERDYVATEEILNRLISSDVEGFKYIVVLDEENQIFAQAGEFNTETRPELDQDINSAIDDGVYDTRSSLYVGKYQVGNVLYGVSIHSFLRSRADLLEQGLIIASVELILTLIILSLTGYFLTRHIGELIRFADQVSSGNYDASRLTTNKDEFGVLANAFQNMTRTIKLRIDELYSSEQALARSKAEFESVFKSITESVIFVDKNRVVIMSNPAVSSMFGYEPGYLEGKTLEFLYVDETLYHAQAKRFTGDRAFLGEPFEIEYRRKDGSTFTGESVISAVRDANNELLGFVGIVRDVTERIETQRALAESRERAQVTLESIGDAVITTDTEGRVQYLNPVAEEITAWDTEQAMGRPLAEIFHIVNELTKLPIRDPVKRCLDEEKIIDISEGSILVNREGIEYLIEDSAAPIRNYDGEVIGAVLVFHDVTNTRSMSRQLVWQATHDSLTGLLNRNEFESYLSHMLAECKRYETRHALLYLDLDQFKLVNDTCGHVAGDELLRQLSHLLQSQLRETDYIARMGGDEFGILLDEGDVSLIREIADRLRKTVEEFIFVWNNKSFRIGASIGVVQLSEESESISQVLSAADMACYIAKDSGRNRIHIHTPDDREVEQRHGEMHWVSRLNEALEKDHLLLYCQKIRPLSDRNGVEHFEVLLRLQDGDTIIQPLAFIPAAERYNIMPQIDRWVVTKVFDWLQEYGKDFDGVITINLSGTTLGDKTFLPFVTQCFNERGIDPAQICFEITETAAITNLSLAMGFIAEVKRLGASFALDDFGSGLSSFNYLKNLDVDYIKIDGAFVRDIDKDLVSYTMVESICHVGRVMGLKTIAEFVENDAILQKLSDLGVDYVQGYGIHRPQALGQLFQAMADSSS
ncbi:MAG: EAL domain-containing protein [Gammaproteobacteria bacterium]|nr:EAL domain-containing protein [Gammaproteobacteria bacterium]